jgi:Na+/H+-dicarboxylate symporter
MNKQSRLTTYILIGLVLGIITGYFAHDNLASPTGFADTMALVTTLFLRLIKMIIAPLVFSTLVCGIAKMGDATAVGRVGVKTLGWFFIASVMSLSLGLVLVNIFRPGDALLGHMAATAAKADLATSSLTLKDFVTHLVPSSIVDGMAKNEILQIVIFSLFFGSAAAAVGPKANALIEALDGVAHVMLKVTGYVMKFAPFAVFAAVAGTIAKSGLGVLSTYGVFMAEFYFGIALLWALLIFIGFLFLKGRVRADERDAQPGAAGLLDRIERSGLSENAGRPGAFRRAQPHRLVRAADRLLVQPRWLDDVLHLRHRVHRAGLRH